MTSFSLNVPFEDPLFTYSDTIGYCRLALQCVNSGERWQVGEVGEDTGLSSASNSRKERASVR